MATKAARAAVSTANLWAYMVRTSSPAPFRRPKKGDGSIIARTTPAPLRPGGGFVKDGNGTGKEPLSRRPARGVRARCGPDAGIFTRPLSELNRSLVLR